MANLKKDRDCYIFPVAFIEIGIHNLMSIKEINDIAGS